MLVKGRGAKSTGSAGFTEGDFYDCNNNQFLARTLEIDTAMGFVWENLRATIGSGNAFFGTSRPKITTIVDPAMPLGTTFYFPTGDSIRLTATEWQGTRGVFVTAHEYGHAFHERALGGINTNIDNVPGGTSCANHPFLGAKNIGCGLSEGFADYYSAVVRGAALPNLEYNSILNGGGVDGNEDGAEVESFVAAFLWDLTDSGSADGSESHDLTVFPGSYVAAIVRTCMVNASGWRDDEGIDHLIYCMERQIDPNIVADPSLFTERSEPGSIGDPIGFSEGATEPGTWSAGDIRSNWMFNLYRR